MASAQVLPNSSTVSARKQEHLHKGKSLLEEFRKKKAAGKAKKAVPQTQAHVDGIIPDAKQPIESERIRHTNTDGDAVSSTGSGRESSGAAINKGENRTDVDKNNEPVLSNDLLNTTHPTNESKAVSAVEMQSLQAHAKDNWYMTSGYNGPSKIDCNEQNRVMSDGLGNSTSSQGSLPYEIPDTSFSFRSQPVRDINGSSSQSSYLGTEEALLNTSSPLKDAEVMDPGHAHIDLVHVSNESGKYPLENKSVHNSTLPNGHIFSSYEGVHFSALGKEFDSEVGQKMHDHMLFEDQLTSDSGGENNSSFDGRLHNPQSGTSLKSEYLSSSFNFNTHPEPLYPATGEHKSRRFRPSFLDSLNMSKAALPAPSSTEPKKSGLFMSDSSASYDTSLMGSNTSQNPLRETKMEEHFSKFGNSSMPSAFEHSMASSFASENGTHVLRYNNDESSFERSHKYQSSKQDEDFASLEQHIEDLTQEKFSLQRAVEASRALAESLAAENSSLTESYNQQGSFVNQLKSEMESLQEDIKAQLEELESVKMEYGNVLLECNAADERGKLIASEVIGLEEKALRLRSNELKLERQLENSYAEMASYRKKLSSVEKDRQDLQSTLNALQEEKKLLQDKLWKASVSGKSVNVSKSPEKKDTSTSTEDLDPMPDTSNLDMHNSAAVLPDVASSSTLLAENREFNLEVSSANIPPDQTAMIQNIDLLISEIAFEKEELIKALAAESSQSSMLKELNKELSRKLESQTQRLELLTAQSMANGNISTRQSSDTQNMHDNSAYLDKGLPQYADEGDEVVERVLGWIMKLFPGGPSKRRTSKLL